MKYWVARDKRGECYLYEGKPIECTEGVWQPSGHRWYSVSPRLFPEVTFENSPQEVELKLIK